LMLQDRRGVRADRSQQAEILPPGEADGSE
jgi:hypothetical protein